jgi:hypothetical protein
LTAFLQRIQPSLLFCLKVFNHTKNNKSSEILKFWGLLISSTLCYTIGEKMLNWACNLINWRSLMNKNLIKGMAVAVIMFAGTSAEAIDSTGGCGLGSMAWKGQSGIIPQVLAMSTNATFMNTIGVTLGTSGCDPNGRVTGGTGKLVLAVIENNMEQFAMDASAGQGETIETLAGILNVDSSELGAKAQANFAYLFDNENVEAVDVALRLMEIANA